MRKVKWGIIGPGKIANQFASDFQFVENATVHAVASNNLQRAHDFAKKYEIPNVYDSYDNLYADPDIDIVYIATPHSFHLMNTTDAIKAGKSVLCEKPITTNLSDCKQVIDLAKKSDQYLMEGMWTYFLPAIQKAREWIKEGRIGKVLSLKADFGLLMPYDSKSRLFNPDLAGGSLLDVGIYTIAMTWLVQQKNPTHITVISRYAPTGVDKDVNMLFEYNDSLASLHSSFQSKLNNHAYIIGEEGYIDLPDFWRARECHLYKKDDMVDHFSDDRQGSGFEYEIESVSRDIIEGKKESDIVSHETSIHLQEHMALVFNKMK